METVLPEISTANTTNGIATDTGGEQKAVSVRVIPISSVIQQLGELIPRKRVVPQKLKLYVTNNVEDDVEDDVGIKKVHIEIETDAVIGQQSKGLEAEQSSSDVNNSVFKCLHCGKMFSTKGNLKDHIMAVHDEWVPFAGDTEEQQIKASRMTKKPGGVFFKIKPHICDVCNKCFSSKNALKEHGSRHTGAKNYTCQHCSAEFRQISCLSRHLLRHSDETGKYMCSVCNKKFKMAMYLKSHMKSHTGEKPFGCDVCKKNFAHRSDLNRHKIIHTGNKPFACRLCTTRFNDSSSRRRHEREHAISKPYACEYCNEAFKRSGQLKTHVARKHNYIYTQQIVRNTIGTNAEEIMQFPLTTDNDTSALLKSVATKLQDLPMLLNGQQVTLVSMKNPPDVSDKKSDTDNLDNLNIEIEETPDFSAVDEDIETFKTENDDDIKEVMDTMDPEVEPEHTEPVKMEVICVENNITSSGIIQRVSLPKVNGQTVALDAQALLDKIKDKIVSPKEEIQISCTLLEDCDNHQIMEVHYHNVHPKSKTHILQFNETETQPGMNESILTDKMEQNAGLPESSELPVTSLSSTQGDAVLYLVSEENLDISQQHDSLLTSTETRRYSTNPDFTSQDYYNWLSAFCEVCKGTEIPLTTKTYKTIAKVLSDLTEVMAQPQGVLANKENFKILMNLSKDFSNIIEKHLEHLLSTLCD